ncbi:T9SS type A sorting domain-containing protein [Flavobacterium sp.]|uniref:T9SS type A sorting domain-containing protein n=1 Tax=Flavobacterium sp. TaxID=239 RepID=UPI0037509DBE
MKKVILIFIILNQYSCYSQCWNFVDSGGNNTFAIKSDGTLWGTGSNNYGQVGNGGNSSNPPVLNFVEINNPSQWLTVSSSSIFTHAIKSDGTLWAWGSNLGGGIGNGASTSNNYYYPIQIGTNNNWKFIHNRNTSFGIKTDGTLWGWSGGILGNGSNIGSSVPIQIGTGTNWKSICRNINTTTFAIKTDGTLWGWGQNSYGELNNGSTSTVYTPIQIGNDNKWKDIQSGDNNYLGLKTDGTLWSWGQGYFGQLGNGSPDSNYTITQIGSENDWDKIAASRNSNCFAIKVNKTLWGWGRNAGFSLGNGTETNILSPTQIGIDSDWQMVSAGGASSIGLKTDNSIYVWGFAELGALGNGGGAIVTVPTALGTCTLANENFTKTQITIYPNPTKNTLNITTTIPLHKIIIYNLLGAKVYEQAFNESIDVSNFASGVYVVKFYGEDNVVFVEKIVKE